MKKGKISTVLFSETRAISVSLLLLHEPSNLIQWLSAAEPIRPKKTSEAKEDF